MKLPIQEPEQKQLVEKIAQQYTGAQNTGDIQKLNSFKTSISNIQKMVQQHSDKSDPAMERLNNRLQAMSELANGIDELYFQGGNSQATCQKIIDSFNTLTNETGDTSLRDDVNQFISANAYSLIDNQDFKNLMNIVNSSESLEMEGSLLYRESQLKFTKEENEKDLSPSQFGENDPDIQAFTNLSKAYPEINSYETLSHIVSNGQKNLDEKRSELWDPNLTKQQEQNKQLYESAKTEWDLLSSKYDAGAEEIRQAQIYEDSYNRLQQESAQLKEQETIIKALEDQVNKYNTITKDKEIIESTTYSQSFDMDAAKRSQSFLMMNTKDLANSYMQSVEDAHKARNNGDIAAEQAAMKQQETLYAQVRKADAAYTDNFLKKIKDSEAIIVNAHKEIEANDMDLGRSKLSKTSKIGMVGVTSNLNRQKASFEEKMNNYKKELNYMGPNNIDALLSHGKTMYESSSNLVKNSSNVEAYRNGKERLDELSNIMKERAPDIRKSDLITQASKELDATQTSLENATKVKAKLDERMNTINAGIDRANERTSSTMQAMKNEANPQIEKTYKALSSIASHIDDMTSKGHSNSTEFEWMSKRLKEFSQSYKAGNLESCKDSLYELRLRAETYYNAKTKDGKNVNRVTTMGKVRLNYAKEIMGTLDQLTKSEAKWEKQAGKVEKLGENQPTKMTSNDFAKKVNQKLPVAKAPKEKTKTVSEPQKVNEKKSGGRTL